MARFINRDNKLGHYLSLPFTPFCDNRERKPEQRLILTHLYLLIGLGIPTNLTYILLDGGFPDGEMTIFAYSGVAFLGIADSMAAITGMSQGKTFWRPHYHKKSLEGSIYAIMLTCIWYYLFCAKVYAPFCELFGIVFFATFIACIVEGWTT